MKITRESFKNIVRETMIEENEYQEFFKKALEKTGKSIPDMSDEEKKAFFNKIDTAWQGKGEKKNEGQSVNEKSSDPFLDFGRSKGKKPSASNRVDRVAKYGNYKFEFDDKKFIVSLLYNGKQIAYGYPDWSTGGYIMTHLSWGTQEKKFESLEDIIKYFKSKKITTDGLNEAANLKTIAMFLQNKGIKVEESVNESSSKEKEIYAKIEKLRVLSNAGKITGDQFLDKFFPLWKQLKGMKESVVNEDKYTVIDPKGNQLGTAGKNQVAMFAKKKGGEKAGYFVVSNKNALKARRALEKFKGDFQNPKLKDIMAGLYESVKK